MTESASHDPARPARGETGGLERAQRQLIADRFPRFAAVWLLLGGAWRLVLLTEGRLSPMVVFPWQAAVLALLVLAAWVCRSAPGARRVPPVALASCLLLGTSAVLHAVYTGLPSVVVGFNLFALAGLAAISFGWGWRREALLVAGLLALWATAAPHLESWIHWSELATGAAIGSVICIAAAELYTRSFRHAWRQRREKRRIKRALAASYRAYRDLAENAPALIYTHDLAGRITYVNETAARYFGLSGADVFGRSVFDIVLQDPDNPDLRAAAARVVAGEHVPPLLIKVGASDGPRVLECVVAGISDETNGRIIGVRGVAHDVTARVLAERAQAERRHVDAFSAEVGIILAGNDPLATILQRCAEAMVRHLDAALARIWLLDDEGRMLTLTASAGLYTHLDGAHGRIPVGSLKIGLIAQERVPQLTNAVIGDPRVPDQEWAKRTGMVAFAGYPMLLGERVLGVVGMFARRELGSEILGGLAALCNVLALGIDRKRSEAALHDSVEALRRREFDLHQLAQRQATIREEERKRISVDLHEDVCQDVVGVGILLESLRQQLAPLHPEVATPLQRAAECLAGVAEHMRLLARELRPMILRDLGLGESLRALVNGMQSAQTAVRFVYPTPIPPLDEDTEIGVYRIAQEALANAQRHAAAHEIVVTLGAVGGMLELEVRDDGRGFGPEQRSGSGGLGLLAIEERALALGGRLTVSSRPGAGTTVRLECPFANRTPATAA